MFLFKAYVCYDIFGDDMKEDFTKRDSNIVKGIAIILMIFHHLFRLKDFSDGYAVSFFPFSVGRIAQICTFFKICVPLFVFVSGYGLLKAYKNTKNKKTFFFQRYIKLMPTFWIVIIISFIYGQITSNMVTNTFFQKDFYQGIANIFFNFAGLSGLLRTVNFNENWWYIGASLVFIFLVPVIYNLAKKYGWLNIGLGIIIIPRVIGISNFSTVSALPYVFILYLGMFCEEKEIIKKIVNKHLVSNAFFNKILKLAIYLISLLVMYVYSTHMPRNIVWELHFGLTPFIVILISKEFISIIPIISKILESLGKYSYIIFLIHGLIIITSRGMLLNGKHFLVSGILLLLISYIVSFVIEKLMELIGYKKIFKKLEKRLS